MDLDALYRAHVKRVMADTEAALEHSAQGGAPYGGVVIYAGGELLVHRDDQPYLFRPDFHFARWAPIAGPDHLVQYTPGQRPRLVRVVPRDYWYETPAAPPVPVEDVFEVIEVEDIDAAVAALGTPTDHVFIGFDEDVAEALGIEPEDQEPELFLAAYDWTRAYKTGFEVECTRRAGARAARGHDAVREGAFEGRSELELHFDYLAATAMVESEVPYPAIIGWDRHAAILHYQSKQVHPPHPGHVLLIDAGASVLGYASDITRTYAREGAPSRFVDLLDGMERLQRDLVAGVAPGVPYPDLHHRCHEGVARLLSETGVVTCSADAALEQQLTLAFLPHGLGHHLGLQVHDVGGRQVDPAGNTQDPPAEYPHLRTTRTLEEGHLVTVEPGVYFIPMLLDPLRDEARGHDVDWSVVEELLPCGGIRIEDDVLVTATGGEDLTRPFVPGHQD